MRWRSRPRVWPCADVAHAFDTIDQIAMTLARAPSSAVQCSAGVYGVPVDLLALGCGIWLLRKLRRCHRYFCIMSHPR